MVLIKFGKEGSLNQVIGLLDFSRNLIIDSKSGSEEFNLIIKSIKEIKPYRNIFPFLMVRADEVDVILGNSIWVLEQTLENENIEDSMKVIYNNSIGLMKEVKEIILSKKNKYKPKIIGGRKYSPQLEKFYKSNLNSLFIFSSGIEPSHGLIAPKKGDEWKLVSYVEANPKENIEEPEEDYLIIENNSFVKYALAVSDFNQLAFLKE